MSVTLDEVFVVVVLLKNTVKVLVLVRQAVVLHTSSARRVRVLIVVALCDVGLLDDSSNNLSVCVGFL